MLYPICIVLAFLSVYSFGESVEEDSGDQYFGVPLGAYHFSSDGTSAEIYAADEFTIIFNHFYHNPRQPGCTAMMLGPPRNEDHENVIDGHGVLIASAHPPVARRRRRRQVNNDMFSGWPIEFDHLLMGPAVDGAKKDTAEVKGTTQKTPVPNDLIEKIHFKPTSQNETLLQDLVQNTTSTTSYSTTLNSTLNPLENSTQSHLNIQRLVTQPSDDLLNIVSISPNRTTKATSTVQPSTSTTTGIPATTSKAVVVTQNSTESTETTVSMEPLILPKNRNPKKQTSRPLSKVIEIGQGHTASGATTQVNMDVIVTSSGETFVVNPRVLNDALQNSNGVRRSPARKNYNEFRDSNEASPNLQEFETKGGAPAATGLGTTTQSPLFWVIKDPRETRRQRLLELRKKFGNEKEFKLKQFVLQTTTPLADSNPTRFDSRFELPKIRDRLSTFSLTNGAKINQYKWIGIYDQCLKRHIPLVSLRDVDPPREEKISPLSGWAHNVSSFRVHILNCNTILIPGFTYDGTNTTSNTYIFVGIGQFPGQIERQVKATIVGTNREEPLRNYKSEDILLRLPRHFRTFDIDYISIYNTDQKKSYGHVLIPSLLVPPCTED